MIFRFMDMRSSKSHEIKQLILREGSSASGINGTSPLDDDNDSRESDVCHGL